MISGAYEGADLLVSGEGEANPLMYYIGGEIQGVGE
jgi:hypothetical protein